MKDRVIKKNFVFRLASYLLILPFIPALRPIIGNHSTGELIVFISGFVLMLFLVIYSNNRPFIRMTDKNLFIYLLYRHKPEIHSLGSIEEAKVKSARRMELRSAGFDPLDIRLSGKEMDKLCNFLEKEGVPVNRAYRNS